MLYDTTMIMMHPKASAEELEKIRQQCTEQIAINEKYAAQIKAAAPAARSYAYMRTVIDTEEINGGVVYNPTNIEGTQNNTFTRFLTASSNQGAAVYGRLADSSGNYNVAPPGSAVNVLAKLGPTGGANSGNYIIVWLSKTGTLLGTWTFLGYAQITTSYSATYPVWYPIGYLSDYWGYAAVGTNTMMGGLASYNDVMVDCIDFSW